MIRAPRRSVTRFFIPLIDVLLLLFCIFLLMPLGSEEKLRESQDASKSLSEDVESLEREIQQLREQMLRFRSLEPKLRELDQLLEKLDRLEKAGKKNLLDRVAIQVIDIDGKTGAIYFYDAGKSDAPRIALGTEASVNDLIERHKRENPGRELYYFFLYPRPETGFPTFAQERRLKSWFRGVAHSLKENEP